MTVVRLFSARDSSGYAVGSLMAATLAGRMVGVYFWGVTADRYGRRPVIFVSLWSTAAFAVAFGFSTTFFWALAFRYALHLDNRSVNLFRCMVTWSSKGWYSLFNSREFVPHASSPANVDDIPGVDKLPYLKYQ